MADTTLVFTIIGKDFGAAAALRKVARDAENSKSRLDRLNDSAERLSQKGFGALATAAIGLGPALLPVLAGATVAAGGLSTALVAGGAALGVFGAVAKTVWGQMHTAMDKVTKAEAKLANAKTTKQRAAAQKDLAKAYAGTNGAMAGTVGALDRLKAAWKGFASANQGAVFSVMTRGFNLLASIIPKLQPLFTVAAAAIGRFLRPLEQAVKGGGFDRFVKFLAGQAGPALDNFGKIVMNLGRFFGGLLRAFAPVAQGILGGLADMTARWATWSATLGASTGFRTFVAYAVQNGPLVWATLKEIGQAVGHLIVSLAPLGGVSLTLVKGLAAIVNALPPGVITAVAAAFFTMSLGIKAAAAAAALLNLAKSAFTPWGAALLVAGVAIGMFAKRQAEARARVDELRGSLDQQTGALTKNSRAVAAKQLQDSGAIKAAKLLGLSLSDVTSAALGDKDALSRVNAVIAQNEQRTTQAANGAVVWNGVTAASQAAALKLASSIGTTGAAAKKAQQEQRDLAAATRNEGSASEQQARSIKSVNSQIAALKSKLVQITAGGAANAAAQVAALNRQIAQLRSKVFSITYHIQSTGTVVAGGTSLARLMKAEGGPVKAGKPYIVGERGPEWMIPKTDGTILPHGVMPASAGVTGGGGSVINIGTVSLPGVRSPADFVKALQDYVRSNGPIRGLAFG